MTSLKLGQIGNSVGFALPKEAAFRVYAMRDYSRRRWLGHRIGRLTATDRMSPIGQRPMRSAWRATILFSMETSARPSW